VRRHLGLFDEEASIEDVVLREDEPFYSEFPTDYRLKMDAVRLWMDRVLMEEKPAAAVTETGALVGQVYEAYRRTGRTPEGAFAEIDRFSLEDQVRRHLEVLTPVVEAMRSARRLFRAVVFGEPYGDVPATEGGPAVSRLPALPMTVRTPEADGSLFTRRAELHGLWPWVWQDREDAWHALVLSGSARAPRLPEKTVLEAVLCYLTALAGKAEGERPGPAGVTLHVAYREQRRTMAYALDPAAAGTYLQELVSDYLTASRHGWLPFEAAASLPDAPHRTTDSGGDAVERDRFAAGLEEALSEEDDPLVWIARPEVPEDAYERARRRFGPFFRSGRA